MRILFDVPVSRARRSSRSFWHTMDASQGDPITLLVASLAPGDLTQSQGKQNLPL